MLLKLQTWNGNNINDWNGSTGSFEAVIIPGANYMPGVTPEYADLGDNYPILTGISIGAAAYTFQIVLHGVIHTAIDTLNKYFRVDVKTSGQLIAIDTADSNRQWYVTGRVVQPPMLLDGDRQSTVTVVLALEHPYWEEYTLQTTNWSITTSGATVSITPRGNLPTNPTYKFTPTTSKTGSYAYRRFYAVRNPGDTAFFRYPFSLTGTGIDTAALVTAGKMRSDGYDYRCSIDTSAVTTPRWFGGGGINTTTTRFFVNLNLKPRIELTLGTAISNSSAVPAVIQFDATLAANKTAIAKLPKKGIFLIDSELFYFTAVSVEKVNVTPSERQSRGTSYAAHSAGATCYFIEHDIWLVYGRASIGAPVISDTYKPTINLTSSHNTSWVWDSVFWDMLWLRSGGWQPNILRVDNYTDGEIIYTGDHATYTDDNAATDPGLKFKAYNYGGVWKSGSGAAEIALAHPAGVTNISGNLEKYRSHTAWPSVVVQKSTDGKVWTTVATLTTPGSAATWTAQAIGSTALGGTYKFVRLLMDGATAAIANAWHATEINDWTCTLPSAAVPQVFTGPEIANYLLDMNLANAANGYGIAATCVMGLNVPLIIDTENLTCTAPTGEGIPLEVDSGREDWLPLEAGVANVLTYTDTGTGNVTGVITHRGRNSL